ncbi:hypothetical protein GTP44_10435 [Duganella sp. FT50W]|uniref:Colicin import membrane protein n=1 Tax=Duganella lactea TaxID=2692173 RepID=A0A6L8MQB4_9BURK|nr:hypothetical protein [Duganella lactea]MYM82368.1 hypothetical protein [Duganella lactea]
MKARLVMIALAVLSAAAQAQQVTSVEQADAALVKVAQDREAVNAAFAESERVCNNKFFVNNCLDKAKEKRRVALAAIRAREVDAEHFKRVASVAKRDADLAERARKEQEDAATRAAQAPRAPKEEHAAPKPPTGPRVADREAEFAAKQSRQAQQDAAGAAQRAANVEAFARKQEESRRRQEIVARKKAENAEKARLAAEKEAAAAKKAAAKQQAPAQ